jgi:hypothetical protein
VDLFIQLGLQNLLESNQCLLLPFYYHQLLLNGLHRYIVVSGNDSFAPSPQLLHLTLEAIKLKE